MLVSKKKMHFTVKIYKRYEPNQDCTMHDTWYINGIGNENTFILMFNYHLRKLKTIDYVSLEDLRNKIWHNFYSLYYRITTDHIHAQTHHIASL